VGSNDGRLYALDADSGVERWRLQTKGRVVSSPAVAGGRVYVLSYDGHLHAADARTGAALWSFATGGERRFAHTNLHGAEPAAELMPDPFDFFLSSPAVVDGVVYFGSGDGHVYALDAASGALRWKFAAGSVVHASPAVVDGTLYIGDFASRLYAIDTASGRERWRFQAGTDPQTGNQQGFQASPIVVDGVVYAGCRDSKFYALDAATGRERWAYSNKGSWVIGSAIVDRGRVYFATSDTGLLHALDASNGTLLHSIENRRWPMFSSPAIAGDTLYLGTHEGILRAIDLRSFTPAWAFQTDGHRANGASLTDAKGQPDYAAAYGEPFYDAVVVGLYKLLGVGAVLSSPAIAGDTVYFGSTDGHVYAVR
jgi:outer membrane protein assembly factor BamB